jgi:membrane protein
VLVLISIAIIVAIPVVLNFIPNASVTAILLEIVRWPLLFVLVAGAIAVVYRYAPCRGSPPPKWRWILWSAAAAALVWLCVSALFSWYVAHFGSYNKTYGSLGAIFGFMTWMWISMAVVLIGAKLNSELERRFPQ